MSESSTNVKPSPVSVNLPNLSSIRRVYLVNAAQKIHQQNSIESQRWLPLNNSTTRYKSLMKQIPFWTWLTSWRGWYEACVVPNGLDKHNLIRDTFLIAPHFFTKYVLVRSGQYIENISYVPTALPALHPSSWSTCYRMCHILTRLLAILSTGA